MPRSHPRTSQHPRSLPLPTGTGSIPCTLPPMVTVRLVRAMLLRTVLVPLVEMLMMLLRPFLMAKLCKSMPAAVVLLLLLSTVPMRALAATLLLPSLISLALPMTAPLIFPVLEQSPAHPRHPLPTCFGAQRSAGCVFFVRVFTPALAAAQTGGNAALRATRCVQWWAAARQRSESTLPARCWRKRGRWQRRWAP